VRVAIYNTAVRGCTYGLYASTNVSPYDRANAYTLAKGCRLEGCGRGAYLHGGGLVLDGCTVHGNSTGIQEDSGTVGVSNCTITDNTTGVFNNSDSNTGAVGGLGNNTLEQNTNGNSFAVAFSLE